MIRKSVWLACAPERAFDVWVDEISSWWPADRRHTGDARSALVLDPGGRFFERSREGREVELGRVRERIRPEKLVLDFFPGTDPDHPTRVTVTFTAENGGTLVLVVHEPTELSRDLWDARAPRYEASWDRVLGEFERAI